MPKRRFSIGRKLLWSIALPGLCVAVAGVGIFWRQADRAVRNSTEQQATALSELIASAFSAAGSHATPPGTEVHSAVRELIHADWKTFHYVRDLRVIDRSGVVRWSRRTDEEGKPISVPAVSKPGEIVRPLGGVACAGCHTGETTMRVGVLELGLDTPSVYDEVGAVFLRALAAVLVFSLVLALAAAISLRAFIWRPLRRLTKAMQLAEAGDFLVRADARSQDEIGELADAFNRMLARLTAMKAEEIDTHRDLAAAQEELTLKKQLEKRVNELTLLYGVASSLTSTLELSELFNRITELVAEQLKIPQFSVMLLTADGQLEVKSAYPSGEGTEGLTFRVGEGVCGRAAASLEPIYVPDISEGGAQYLIRSGSPREVGSLLSVPMLHKGALLGVLNFQRPEPRAFPQEELDLLKAVGELASLAVKNASLHEETVALSITDPLTGAPNRRHLFSRLEMEIVRANRFGTQLSVLMIDIDHFKQLNDANGHRAGDDVLRRVATLLRASVRKVDLMGRYGGEEFLILLPQVAKAEAVDVAEKLRRTIEETPFEYGRSQPLGKITISVGVANLPTDANLQDKLVDCADSALYACKRAGRNKAIGYATGMELHPGRERGPHAAKRKPSGEQPAVAATGTKSS